jgi:hypothetical protein
MILERGIDIMKLRPPPPKGSTNRLFIFLLIGLLSLFVSTPLMYKSFLMGLLGDVVFYLMLFAAIFQIRNSRMFWVALALLVATLTGDITTYFTESNAALIATNFFSCGFIIVIVIKIVVFVIREPTISVDTVMGGLCTYLLLGIFWMYFYINLELITPGSFNFRFHDTAAGLDRLYMLLFYYSYVTLLTIGFGDIVPVTSAAQTLTVLEGLIGQMYIVFFISTLVGMYISSRKSE